MAAVATGAGGCLLPFMGTACDDESDCPGGQVCITSFCQNDPAGDGDGDVGDGDGDLGDGDGDGDGDGGATDSGAVDGGRLDSGVLDGGPVDGRLTDSGVLDGGLVDGGLLDGGLVDGGLLDGGLADGGLLDGGLLDGGLLDGGPGPQCPATTTCGDGRIEDTETCDDANGTDGDGCTACVVDDGFACFLAPSACFEESEILRVPGEVATLEEAVASGPAERPVIVLQAGAVDPGGLSVSRAVTVIGEPGAKVVHDVDEPIVRVQIGGSLHLLGLRLEAEPSSNATDDGVRVETGGIAILDRVSILARREAIWARTASTLEVRNSRLTGRQGGIQVETPAYVIEGNVISAFGGFAGGDTPGVRFDVAPASESVFRFNTITGGVAPPAGVAGGVHCVAGGNVIDRSIVTGNEVLVAGDPHVSPSCVVLSSLIDVKDAIDATGALVSGSPAIDAVTGPGPSFDLDGDPRPSGLTFDIGADEDDPLRPAWVNAPDELRLRVGESVAVPWAAVGEGTLEIASLPAEGMVSGAPDSLSYQGLAPGAFSLVGHVLDEEGCPGPPARVVLRVFPADWWDVGFSARRRIEVDTGIATSLPGFPVPLRLEGTLALDFTRLRADGADLRFVDDSGTELAAEVEVYEEGVRALVWVRLPEAGLGAVDIWQYQDHPAPLPPGSPPTAVWAGEFEAVFHFADRTDATGHGFDVVGADDRPSVAGGVGPAWPFAQAPAGLSVGAPVLLADEPGVTLSCYARVAASASKHPLISIGTGTNPATASRAAIEILPTGEARIVARSSDADPGFIESTPSAVVPLDTWTHIAGVVDYAAGTLDLYVDGTNVLALDVSFSALLSDATQPVGMVLGGEEDRLVAMNGALDECRIEGTARSPDWVLAAYRALADDIATAGPLVAPVDGP